MLSGCRSESFMRHRSWLNIRLVLLIPMVGFLGWVWSFASQVEPGIVQAVSPLLADPPVLNLGRVTSIQSPVEFKVTNQSSSDITIQQLRSSCGCMNPTADKYLLAPDEFAVVSAVMRHAKTGEGSELSFNRSVTVLYKTEGQAASLVLGVTGLFLPPVWVDQQAVQFQKSENTGRSISAEVPVFLREDPAVQIKTAHVFGRDLDCETEIVESESGSSGFLTQLVRIHGKALRLPASGTLLITTDAPETPQLRVVLVCQSDDPFRLDCVPPRVTFGVVEPQQRETKRVVLTWAESANADIEFVHASEGFSVNRSALIGQNSGRQICAIDVTASLADVGAIAGEITIGLRGKQDSAGLKEVRVPISGFVRALTQDRSADE